MNKAELIEEISGKVGITKKEVGNIIDATTYDEFALAIRYF